MSRIGQRPRIVRAVRPIRVLVASRDKRFMRVTAFLLRRAGFGVEVSSRPDALVALVAEHEPSVVVFDAGSSAEAQHVVAALTAASASTSIVVLTDDAAAVHSSPTIRVAARWCPFEELVQEIESLSSIPLLPPQTAF